MGQEEGKVEKCGIFLIILSLTRGRGGKKGRVCLFIPFVYRQRERKSQKGWIITQHASPLTSGGKRCTWGQGESTKSNLPNLNDGGRRGRKGVVPSLNFYISRRGGYEGEGGNKKDRLFYASLLEREKEKKRNDYLSRGLKEGKMKKGGKKKVDWEVRSRRGGG